MEFLLQSKQPPSKLSKNLTLNRKPSCKSLRSFVPKLLLLLVKIFYCFCCRPPNEDSSWMDVFDNFMHEVCDQFDNMVISDDFNLPDILWDSIDSASGVNELAFIKTLHDHVLTQLNKKTHSWQQEKSCYKVSQQPRRPSGEIVGKNFIPR